MGLFEAKVYVDDPTTTRALREEIKRCIDEIQPISRKIDYDSLKK